MKEDEVKIEVAEKHIVMSFDNKIFFSRLLEGEFIDYERAIPKSNKIFVKIYLQFIFLFGLFLCLP